MALRSDNVRVLLVLGFFHLAVIVTTSDKLYFTLFSLFALAYASYYVTFVVHQPDIHCSRSPIERFLRAHCPAMFATFYPTIWTAGGHARTIVRCIFQRTPPSIEFSRYRSVANERERAKHRFATRETLSGADGGLFCIDWITEKGTRSLRGRDRIVVVIPGVTGKYLLVLRASYFKCFFRWKRRALCSAYCRCSHRERIRVIFYLIN